MVTAPAQARDLDCPPLPFGTAVLVHAISHRVVREREVVTDYHHPLGRTYGWFGSWHGSEGTPRIAGTGLRVSEEVLRTADWTAGPKEGRAEVRVCTDHLPVDAWGIIVGYTSRYEGFRDENPASDLEDREAWLEPSKRVPVYEVALEVGPYRKARVVTVQPKDLERGLGKSK